MRKILTTFAVVVVLTAVAESRFHAATHPQASAQPSTVAPVQPRTAPSADALPSPPAGTLPDPHITPGAVATTDTALVCHRSTRLIRPPALYTEALKREQILQYRYADTNLRDYEEDHLVPLELGGDPRDPRNLWPESRLTYPGAVQKDAVENALHEQVCSGALALVAAQREIAANWYAAWLRLGRP